MSECCQDKCKSEFWNWWSTTEQTFTRDQVQDLLENVKQFNAGAIDPYLTKHVDNAFIEWANKLKS